LQINTKADFFVKYHKHALEIALKQLKHI